jgi:hypothetical protein
MSELTVEQVCGKLTAGGVDAATVGRVFAARLEPQNLEDPERKFVLAVPGSHAQAFLVVYKFGPGTPLVKDHPLAEGGPDWRPRFLSVEGPFPSAREAIEARARELTA